MHIMVCELVLVVVMWCVKTCLRHILVLSALCHHLAAQERLLRHPQTPLRNHKQQKRLLGKGELLKITVRVRVAQGPCHCPKRRRMQRGINFQPGVIRSPQWAELSHGSPGSDLAKTLMEQPEIHSEHLTPNPHGSVFQFSQECSSWKRNEHSSSLSPPITDGMHKHRGILRC